MASASRSRWITGCVRRSTTVRRRHHHAGPRPGRRLHDGDGIRRLASRRGHGVLPFARGAALAHPAGGKCIWMPGLRKKHADPLKRMRLPMRHTSTIAEEHLRKKRCGADVRSASGLFRASTICWRKTCPQPLSETMSKRSSPTRIEEITLSSRVENLDPVITTDEPLIDFGEADSPVLGEITVETPAAEEIVLSEPMAEEPAADSPAVAEADASLAEEAPAAETPIVPAHVAEAEAAGLRSHR